MTTPDPDRFADLRGDLASHEAELMAAHGGQPTITEQDRTHGAGIPPVDRGESTGPDKYDGSL